MLNFKVGDWVTTPHRGTFRIEHEMELASWEITLGGQAKLWQPKLNEWCWFSSIGNFPVLVQYTGEILENQYKVRYRLNDYLWTTKLQPFIGQLPTQIKG